MKGVCIFVKFDGRYAVRVLVANSSTAPISTRNPSHKFIS